MREQVVSSSDVLRDGRNAARTTQYKQVLFPGDLIDQVGSARTPYFIRATDLRVAVMFCESKKKTHIPFETPI